MSAKPEPLMTVADAATYSRKHPKTIAAALRAYAASNGRRGLAGLQPHANATWRIRRADLDAWLAGQRPRRVRAA